MNGKSVKVTQMAFPDAITTEVYASALYAAKGQNSLKNAGDMVFSDGDSYELAALSGDTLSGYTATLTIAIQRLKPRACRRAAARPPPAPGPRA